MQLGCSLPVGDIGTGAAVLPDYTQAAESRTRKIGGDPLLLRPPSRRVVADL